MKTILIVIAGMADLPDPLSLRETPLSVASVPSLDMLARRGILTALPPMEDTFEISHKNALLSLLGYDIERGEPSLEELMEYGLDHSSKLSSFPTLRPFILPGFSGHGVCVTTSAWVRGVAKCAFLNPVDLYSPGSSDAEVLETLAGITVAGIQKNEFVLVYVDAPLKASLRGNFDAKVKALQTIDRHFITPVADFVWKSEMLINMAITTDLVTPWHRKIPTLISVPLILYFNNDDREGDEGQSFTEVESMLSARHLFNPSDLMKYLCNFVVTEDDVNHEPPEF